MINCIDGAMLKKLLINGAIHLEKNKAAVDALNVFPVPDGDTGTNMSMTMMAAVKEIEQLKDVTLETVAEALTRGSLRGARGNSGVILSQLFRGFAKGLKSYERVNSVQLAAALKKGVDTAYKAVIKPVEGTMLTVARVSAERAVYLSQGQRDIAVLLRQTIDAGKDALDRTPEMLSVLKEAGVVDAGGKGLIYILEGMIMAIDTDVLYETKEIKTDEGGKTPERSATADFGRVGDIKFTYCTEFIITDTKEGMTLGDIDAFKEKIGTMGDSMLVVGDPDMVKVHVHTNNPGVVLEEAIKLGVLSSIKIDNMREQHSSMVIKTDDEKEPLDDKQPGAVQPATEEAKPYGVVAVAMGEGMMNIFKDLSCDKVIEGGQTMNPSTEDILKAIEEINSDTVFVLPNNGNIILAAQQATHLTGKDVHVIPTKSIPQGIAAMVAMSPDLDIEDNEQRAKAAIGEISTGQVTYAIRDSSYNGTNINEGDILGLSNGDVTIVGRDVGDVAMELLENLIEDDDEIITIYYGQDVSQEDTEVLSDRIRQRFKDCDVEVYFGGQPLYYYIFSIE